MLASLLSTHDLLGATEGEVTALLGEPNRRLSSRMTWLYAIGQHTGLGIDPDYLYVTFEGDRVSNYCVVQH